MVLQAVTRGYMEIQGVKGVTGGHKWLQRVSRGYSGYQGFTRG